MSLPEVSEQCKDVVPKCSVSGDIKSTAIVKYASVQVPSSFSQLQLNTNLNVPPSNWLRSSPILFQKIRERSEFSSINMANNFPDLTGEVDVVSDAENIKKLLKVPFCESSHVSMMVHRIRKTLLLDEFDIHKHLLRQEKEEWRWLRQFFYDIVAKDLQGKMKCVPRKSKSRNTLQNRNMYSKFLYHSLMASCNQNELFWPGANSVSEPAISNKMNPEPLVPLPDPLPQPEGSEFHREVLWTFEDIRMLIGTDLPIFGGGTHPCVSLRLRDSQTPINVLTGLDCWLDNLMCNVPEVAMCFHLNGIVQKYELMKTEDIPQLENSTFDPRVVTDVARNILSFLKSNATKEGHTYWLYKSIDDEFVKLYDLTVLCGEEMPEENSNPFTVPVGILLYRVARNMRQTSGRKKLSTIRTLLENCLLLLSEEKHSQVCTSANYLMSDLYVPDSSIWDVWADSSDDSDEDTEGESSSLSDDECEVKSEISVEIKDLRQINKSYNRGWDVVKSHPIAGTVEERCLDALGRIRKGLDCLARNMQGKKTLRRSTSIVEEQATCNQSEAIPLSYEPLKVSVKDMCLDLQPTMSSSETWHVLSKALLLRKAAMTYFALAKAHMSVQKCGHALRYIRFSVHCFEAMKALIPSKETENRRLLALILELAGDIRLVIKHISRGFEDHQRDYGDMSEDEAAILDAAQSMLITPEESWVYTWTLSMEQNLVDSSHCYEKAYSIVKEMKSEKDAKTNLAKRFGNSLNELGVWYMNQAQVFMQSGSACPMEKMEILWEKSSQGFQRGIDVFSAINDKANQALLHSNKGRLMRLCAQSFTQVTLQKVRPEFSMKERKYYTEAIDCYQRALAVLDYGNQFQDILEAVRWDLSTTYFNMAMLLQDYAPLSTQAQSEIEKDVTDLMNKSLKFCNTDGNRDRTMHHYRAATINHRLASLYHNSYRNQPSDQKRRHLRQLSENHYEKAIRHFQHVESHVELLRIQLERVALMEFFLQSQTSIKGKLRCLHSVLVILASCKISITAISEQKEDSESKDGQMELENLAGIFLSRVQFALLQLVKVYTAGLKSKSNMQDILTRLKSVYAKSLQNPEGNKKSKAKWVWTSKLLCEIRNLQDIVVKDT